MSKYRLYIDMPMHSNEESAIQNANYVIGMLNEHFPALRQIGVYNINVRLGNDSDRQKSNYLDKNENGHVSNKKLVIST